MNEEIVTYIKSCPECQKNKVAMHKSYGLLQPLELAVMPSSSIAMHFITDLTLSYEYSQLWVIIDSFTQMEHSVSFQMKEKKSGKPYAGIG
jgi:hypothetical protein